MARFTRDSVDRVKEAGPVGYDEKIWRQLLDMRIVAMGVPEESGGDGAGLASAATRS